MLEFELDEGVAADAPDWRRAGSTDHFVQFYESDSYLIESVSGFIGTSLVCGEGAVIIATKTHRHAIEELLKSRGLDASAATVRGQFVELDAAETLSRFMLNGTPDPSRFAEVIGGVIESVAASGRPVRAFGEMVALLWAEGNRAAAIRLEELWNELLRSHPLSLFCAYPMNGFASERHREEFGRICKCHTKVMPAESYASLNGADERMRAVTLLQQRARSLEAEIAHRVQVERELSRRERELAELLESERTARAEAERLSRLKDEFLATLSHELRTPLNAINGWTELVKESLSDPQTVSEGIAVIDRNVKAQTRLIEDLLDMSRIVSGKVRLEVQRVNLRAVVEAAAEAVRPSADFKEIRFDCTAEAVGWVCGDPHRLQQVVWNLLTNAVKFSTSGGRIQLSLVRLGNHALIEVRDTGQGIDPSFLPHVFERFRQADASTTRRHGGLGLGLSIVKHLVELQGGTIYAHSDGTGKGATFGVKLQLVSMPTSDSTDPSFGAPGTHPLSVRLDGLKVLVVDDEPDSRDVLSRLLSKAGAEVAEAASADEALSCFRSFRPHVMVSDIGMPQKDGYQLMREVRACATAEGSYVPALALTAFARPEERTRAILAGYQVHMSKPVEPRELLATVSGLAGRVSG